MQLKFTASQLRAQIVSNRDSSEAALRREIAGITDEINKLLNNVSKRDYIDADDSKNKLHLLCLQHASDAAIASTIRTLEAAGFQVRAEQDDPHKPGSYYLYF